MLTRSCQNKREKRKGKDKLTLKYFAYLYISPLYGKTFTEREEGKSVNPSGKKEKRKTKENINMTTRRRKKGNVRSVQIIGD